MLGNRFEKLNVKIRNIRYSVLNGIKFYILLVNLSILVSHCSIMDVRHEKTLDQLFWSPIPWEEGEKKSLTADHYIFSNERRIEFFEPYLKNLGGGYIGVGTDQNLTLAAWAKSEFVWLMDFDVYSVRVNNMHISILRRCPTYECFAKAWSPANKDITWSWIEEDHSSLEDFSQYKKVFSYANLPSHIPSRWKELNYMTKKFGFMSFHNREEDYNHLHTLATKNRIRPLKGDLTRKGTLQFISKIATDMKIPIRVFYTSNAEDYFLFKENYRQNILSIPSDESGYHVRTLSVGAKKILGFPEGEKYEDYPFHYNLQKIQNMQEWMKDPGAKRALDIMKGRKPIQTGFSIQEKLPTFPR